MSCRRSSPDWAETETHSLNVSVPGGGGVGYLRCYLENDVDVVPQRIQVLEGQFERDRVGVEEGTGLHGHRST